MNINQISRVEFIDYVYNKTDYFMSKIKASEIFIVKKFYAKEFCWEVRNKSFDNGQRTPSSWHPFNDNCPDYHRLHDNYPQAYVKQKFHGFYMHNYLPRNAGLFKKMADIFVIKNRLAGFNDFDFFENIPSEGILPRINVHHYPKGGGYQSEHIDPNGPFAQIQTIIIASQFGVDYLSGGVYARETLNDEKIYLDSHTEIGDLLVLSPAIPHGVDCIDEESSYMLNENNGRWIILPLFLYSDYSNENNIKPKQL